MHWPHSALLCFLLLAASSCLAAASAPRLELDVVLDPSTRHLQVSAFVVPDSRLFRFALHDSLQITSASAAGAAVKAIATSHARGVREWQVQLPSKATGLRLEYSGTLPPLDRGLDERAALQSLAPMASVEGSFLPAGAAWYPQPAPLFSYRVSVVVPADQRAIVPGRLQSEAVADRASGRYRATFESSRKAEGIALMAGPWIVREKISSGANDGPVRLRTYFPRDLDAVPGLAQGYLEDSARYIDMYSAEIGAYPFSEFSIVASPLPTGFGMPTLTYIGATVLRLPFIRATSLGHEILHNWWGNGVFVDYARGNWSEGLTTFMADYAYKERESAEAAREVRQGWLRDFAAAPSGAHEALASFHSRTHGAAAAVGYGKAAMVFIMLRDLIGKQAFQQAVRAFWTRYREREASWDDLQASFENASGRSLAGFFDQWLSRADGPTVAVAEATARREYDALRLILTMQQATPAYALHIPVEITYGTRRETVWVDIRSPRESLSIDVDAMPQSVRLDPDLRVWRTLEPQQLPPILRSWIVARAPVLVQASRDREVQRASEMLASRLCEIPPETIPAEAIGRAREPVLIVGLNNDVERVLAEAGLPPRPDVVAGRGSAQVWTISGAAGAPVAVISAAGIAALQALARPLPHYGGQSWMVFDGSQLVARGVWPASVPAITVTAER